MKELKTITVIGVGLLGGSVALAILRSFPSVNVIGYAHRASTRKKAKSLAVVSEVTGDLKKSVSAADIVILATPISLFEQIFSEIADVLPPGCIVTDVGSTKVLPHRWAAKKLPKDVHYVGSHPIAGSEQRGIEFARDDLFEKAPCILTTTKKTNRQAVQTLNQFWKSLGCTMQIMSPAQHDKIFANVSHLPHIIAASLVNTNTSEMLKFAGKGFIDVSRIASGTANIWADVLLSNASNITSGIDRTIAQLEKIKKAIKTDNKKQIEQLLENARTKRALLIKHKIKKKELIS